MVYRSIFGHVTVLTFRVAGGNRPFVSLFRATIVRFGRIWLAANNVNDVLGQVMNVPGQLTRLVVNQIGQYSFLGLVRYLNGLVRGQYLTFVWSSSSRLRHVISLLGVLWTITLTNRLVFFVNIRVNDASFFGLMTRRIRALNPLLQIDLLTTRHYLRFNVTPVNLLVFKRRQLGLINYGLVRRI